LLLLSLSLTPPRLLLLLWLLFLLLLLLLLLLPALPRPLVLLLLLLLLLCLFCCIPFQPEALLEVWPLLQLVHVSLNAQSVNQNEATTRAALQEGAREFAMLHGYLLGFSAAACYVVRHKV
jgi:hypothetical protein